MKTTTIYPPEMVVIENAHTKEHAVVSQEAINAALRLVGHATLLPGQRIINVSNVTFDNAVRYNNTIINQ